MHMIRFKVDDRTLAFRSCRAVSNFSYSLLTGSTLSSTRFAALLQSTQGNSYLACWLKLLVLGSHACTKFMSPRIRHNSM